MVFIKALLSADDIITILGVKRSRAYAIIKSLNEELAKEGYYTVSGRVNKAYLYEKFKLPYEE